MRSLDVAIVAAAVLALTGCRQDEEPPIKTDSKVVLSETYTVDRIYPSMTGPQSLSALQVVQTQTEAPELVWMTGYRAVMTGADGETPMSQQFMCHSSLRWGPARDLSFKRYYSDIFTLAQGQLKLDLPPGYGIPMSSKEALLLGTQVLNMHQKEGVAQTRHKTTIDYVRDRDLEKPMKALVMKSVQAMVSLEGKEVAYGVPAGAESEAQKHASCAPGEYPKDGEQNVFKDDQGQRFAAHFVVPPGRHEYRTLATKRMKLDQDTTIHYIAAHLHPFAQWIELRDLTTGQPVIRLNATNLREGIGLEKVESYSSEEGLPLSHDHEYEVAALYDNTSGENQDAMAVMFLYLLDKDFQNPYPAAPTT